MLRYTISLAASILLSVSLQAQLLPPAGGALSGGEAPKEIKPLPAKYRQHPLETPRLKLDLHAMFKPYLWEVWFRDYREAYSRDTVLELQMHTFKSNIGRYSIHFPYYGALMEGLSPVAFTLGTRETYRLLDKESDENWLLGRALSPVVVHVIEFDTLPLTPPVRLAKALKPLRQLNKRLFSKKDEQPETMCSVLAGHPGAARRAKERHAAGNPGG